MYYREILHTRLKEAIKEIEADQMADPNVYDINDVMFEVASIINDEMFMPHLNGENELMYYDLRRLITLTFSKLTSPELGLNAQGMADYFARQLDQVRVGVNLSKQVNRPFVNDLCDINLKIHQRLRDVKTNEIIFGDYKMYQALLNSYHAFDRWRITHPMMVEIISAYQSTASETKENIKIKKYQNI